MIWATGCVLRNKNAFRTKSNYECLALVQEDSVLITPISTTIVLSWLQLKRLDNCVGLCHEIEDATKAVHSLGALLFEMEVIRSYIESYEVPYFDARLAPAHISALKLTTKLQGWLFKCFYR